MISYADTEREITKQPTVENPTVELSDKEGASYQWYDAASVKAADVVDLAGAIVDGEMLATVHNDYYEEIDGVWHSMYDTLGVYIALQDGDILQVTPSEGFVGEVKLPSYDWDLTLEDGVYSHTATRDMSHAYLGIYGEEDFTAQIQVVRGATTYSVISAYGKIYDGQVGAAIHRGSFIDEQWVCGKDNMLDLNVFAKEGQILQVTLSDGFEGTVTMDGEEIQDVGTYSKVVSEDGIYLISIMDNAAYTARISVCDMGIGQPQEGQTTATLTEAEQGKYYACKVTYPNGEELISSFIKAEYMINMQPTLEAPTVGVNYSKGVSYQWYNTGTVTYNMIPKSVEAGSNDRYIDIVYAGSYDSIEGVWFDSSYLDLAVDMAAGEILIVTPMEGFVGAVYDYDSSEALTEEAEGVYVYVATEDTNFNFIVESQDDTAEEFRAKVELQCVGKADAISRETSETLTSGEYQKTYICTVSWENGKTEDSMPVTMEAAITKQPTGNAPKVEINFPDKVKGYQWYDAVVENRKVTFRSGEIQGDAIYVSSLEGSYADDVWISEDGCINFYFGVEAGDTILIAPTGAEGDAEYYLQGYESEGATIESDHGYVTCTIEEDNPDFYLQFYAEGEFSLTVKVKKADGTVYTAQPYDYEANQEVEAYYITGTFKDGIWTSEEDPYFEESILGVSMELKRGDKIIIKLSEGFKGEVMVGNHTASEPSYLSKENGVYTYKATSDGEYAVMVFAETGETTAEIVVERVVFTDAIEGQTTAEFTWKETGLYGCIITLEDDSTLESDYVEITEEDLKDDETDVPTIPNKGDGYQMLSYTLILIVGMSIMAAGLMARRRARL